MLIKLFLFLLSLSAVLKETLWKWWYQALASYSRKDWRFMNYGYAPINEKSVLFLNAEDEKNRLFIQLYSHVLNGVELKGKKVLEIGSGRGGGADFVARTFSPALLTGLDFSKKAIALCKKFYRVSRLKFVEGNAEKLPFEDDSFDVVYNVESSHCYGNMTEFVSEVVRVLKPGGVFAWADLRTQEDKKKDDEIFMKSPLKVVFMENITPNVLFALDQISEQKEKAIKKKVPRFLQKVFSEFAGIRNSKMFKGLQEGKIVYLCYRFQKQ